MGSQTNDVVKGEEGPKSEQLTLDPVRKNPFPKISLLYPCSGEAMNSQSHVPGEMVTNRKGGDTQAWG